MGVDIDDVLIETARTILKELGIPEKYEQCVT